MITGKELIRDTEKILNYCRRLLLVLTMVINILRKRKLSAQESCYFREKIRKTSLNLLYHMAEFETKHELHDWRVALLSLPRCEDPAIKENLSTIEDFSELLSITQSDCSVEERAFFDWKHQIFHVLLEELCGGGIDSDLGLLSSALERALLVFGGGGELSAADTANIKESRILIDEVLVMYMKHKAKACRGMQNLVTWILSAVSLPNLAKQLGSDSASALDRFMATGGMVLYVVAILATVFSYLFRVKKQSKVWRKLANIGLVSVVYALFFSVAFYIPGSHRWLILLPCGILAPAFYVALKR